MRSVRTRIIDRMPTTVDRSNRPAAAGAVAVPPLRCGLDGAGSPGNRRDLVQRRGGDAFQPRLAPVGEQAFTLDRYGHLLPGHDDELRERLDAMHAAGLERAGGGTVVELPAAQARPLAAPARPTAKQATKKARRRRGPGLG